MNLENIFGVMGAIFNSLPGIYWKNKEGVFLGANINQIKLFGTSCALDLIGKTIFEVVEDQNEANLINEIDNKVIQDGMTIVNEETIMTQSGSSKTYLSQKQPLTDHQGNIIGIVGFLLDITEFKKESQQTQIHKDGLLKVVSQVAHDIRSPLSSLLMVIKSCNRIPEQERILLRESATNIGDIANSLLDRFKQKDEICEEDAQEKQPTLVSSSLLQLVSDKKNQYKTHKVKFETLINPNSNFSFIEIEPLAFKRMLSNLVNNAVDALEGREGKIAIQLDAEENNINIIIQDNGKGMPIEIVNKIMNNIPVTNDKVKGNGIGLTQVRETIERNSGQFSIESIKGLGTKVIVTFPKTNPPTWIADKIELKSDDIVIVLDDDHTIHGAWDSRFEAIKKNNPIKVKHFESGMEAIDFINTIPPELKNKILLLTDYELISQKLTGLDVILKTKIEHSILVTSHHANHHIHTTAVNHNTKILPKQLASEIPIHIDNSLPPVTKKTDVVLLDDDQVFVTLLKKTISTNQIVDKYYKPEEFLQNIYQYPKTTKFCINNNYTDSSVTGLEIAQKLHDAGYSNLYMLTGDVYSKIKTPSYLHVILKTNVDDIINNLKHCS